MKRIVLIFTILASFSFTSIVSASPSLQRKGERRDFPKGMNLTDEQKKKMDEVNKDFVTQIEAVKNSKIAKEAQGERISKLRDEKKEATLKILTPEQQELMPKKVRSQRLGKDSAHNGARKNRVGQGEDRPDMKGGMYKDLDLSDAQKEQMKALRSKYGEENRVTAEKYKEEIDNILTPEQQTKLKEQN